MSTHYPYDSYPPPRRFNAWPFVILIVFAGLLAWRFWPVIFPGNGLLNSDVTPRAVTARGDLASDEKTTIEIYERAKPSVVHITALTVHRDVLSPNLQEIPEGTGSGFIWDSDNGYVVTNFHVIQNANAAQITLTDGTKWDARLVGAAPDNDVAVLKISAPKNRLRALPIGTSSDLKVGQKALAIGNPFGLDQSLTTGVVSALDREIKSVTGRPISGVIQTDAAINPGNSGGPLLDSAGRLIGVNTAIYSPSGAYAGIGFAIPVDTVNQVVTELIKSGKVTKPGLGVRIVDDRKARQLGIDKGVLIRDLVPEGAAAQAGLHPTQVDKQGRILQMGDVLVTFSGKDVNNTEDLFRLLQGCRVGDKVKIAVLRDGERQEFDVVLQGI